MTATVVMTRAAYFKKNIPLTEGLPPATFMTRKSAYSKKKLFWKSFGLSLRILTFCKGFSLENG